MTHETILGKSIEIKDAANAGIYKPGEMSMLGHWMTDHYREGKLVGQHKMNNLIVNTAKNAILDTFFNAAAALTTWYAGLINSAGFTSIVATDTIGSHAGWGELTTTYSQATRPLWGQGAASGQAITNAAPIVFSIVAAATAQGLFIVSQNTKGGTTGLLWAAASFPTALPVVNGDELRCTYNVAT